MWLWLSVAHSAATPDRADGERRRELECERRAEPNCPTSGMDRRRGSPKIKNGRKEKVENKLINLSVRLNEKERCPKREICL